MGDFNITKGYSISFEVRLINKIYREGEQSGDIQMPFVLPRNRYARRSSAFLNNVEYCQWKKVNSFLILLYIHAQFFFFFYLLNYLSVNPHGFCIFPLLILFITHCWRVNEQLYGAQLPTGIKLQQTHNSLQSLMIVVFLHKHTVQKGYEILLVFNKVCNYFSFQNSLNQFKFGSFM